MRIIDRYLLRQFLGTFLICWFSLSGLIIVFDANPAAQYLVQALKWLHEKPAYDPPTNIVGKAWQRHVVQDEECASDLAAVADRDSHGPPTA